MASGFQQRIIRWILGASDFAFETHGITAR
jgi:hypothetical protein